MNKKEMEIQMAMIWFCSRRILRRREFLKSSMEFRAPVSGRDDVSKETSINVV